MNISFHSMQLALDKKKNKYALSKAVYEGGGYLHRSG
jgi:hypothetical protein